MQQIIPRISSHSKNFKEKNQITSHIFVFLPVPSVSKLKEVDKADDTNLDSTEKIIFENFMDVSRPAFKYI
jgi:hypothetical protein